LRKYISYAKRYASDPTLTPEACQEIQKFYLTLREENSKSMDASGAGGGGTPVTTRQLESLIRLAEARAKIELRTVVTQSDARDAVELFKSCLRDVADDSSGAFDPTIVDMRGEKKPLSRQQAIKEFVKALVLKAEKEGKTRFTTQEMYNLTKDMHLNLPPGLTFTDFVEITNTYGHILKKGNNVYELAAH
jgi:DNA helicase MCM8